MMMNHVNFFDPLVFYSPLSRAWPGGSRRRAISAGPFYGWMLRRVGMIPISRKDPAKARESLARAAALVRERPAYSIVILPEGTRTLDGNLGPFKRGGFHLALETGLDILPIVQTGAYRINRKGSRLIRPGRVELAVLPPVPVAGRPARGRRRSGGPSRGRSSRTAPSAMPGSVENEGLRQEARRRGSASRRRTSGPGLRPRRERGREDAPSRMPAAGRDERHRRIANAIGRIPGQDDVKAEPNRGIRQ